MLNEAQQHLDYVKGEREYYAKVQDECKKVVKQVQEESSTCTTLNSLPSSATIHYSFDFAQQIQYPSDPFQPGPIYFLSPRKCSIFGICCEGIPLQRNYLIDEAVDCGKGGNSICSMIHHFFELHGLHEKMYT